MGHNINQNLTKYDITYIISVYNRCSIFGINGKIDSLSDSDDFGEEVIYSQESPKMEGSFKDFDWDLNRFVEYKSPFTRKETLPIKKPINLVLGLELKLYLI